MAAFPDGRHRPRIGQGQRLALLDSSQQDTRFDPRLLRERWCLDLAVKPCERLIQPLGHPGSCYVKFDMAATKANMDDAAEGDRPDAVGDSSRIPPSARATAARVFDDRA